MNNIERAMRNVGDIINVNKCAAIEAKLCQVMGALGESNNLLAACRLVWPVLAHAIMCGLPVTDEVATARNAMAEAMNKVEGAAKP